jgi:hypothetical protein
VQKLNRLSHYKRKIRELEEELRKSDRQNLWLLKLLKKEWRSPELFLSAKEKFVDEIPKDIVEKIVSQYQTIPYMGQLFASPLDQELISH